MGKSTAVKQAAVVFGALAFGWLAIEMAFKPMLDKVRAAMDNSDPDHDPDGVASCETNEVDVQEKGDDDDDSSRERPISYAEAVTKKPPVE